MPGHRCDIPVTRLLLVRHGETNWNRENRYQGQSDIELSERGVEQSIKLAATLNKETIAAVYSSHLRRAHATAELLLPLPVQLDPRLREPDYGEFNGMAYAEMEMHAPEIYAQWQKDRSVAPPGGETLGQILNRIRDFMDEVPQKHPDSSIVVVTHGEILCHLLCELLQQPNRNFRQFDTDNCSLTEVEISNGVRLIRFNDTHHLDDKCG